MFTKDKNQQPPQPPQSEDANIPVDLNYVVDSLARKLVEANVLSSKWEAVANTSQAKVLELTAKLVAQGENQRENSTPKT